MRTGPSFQLARAKRVLRPMCQVLVLALALSLLLTVVGGTEYLQCPNVFIIGAMKCGTTTLYQLLSDNPHVCSDGEKEKHYFDKDRYADDPESAKQEYVDEFQSCPSNQLTIDASPDYISTPEVPGRIKESYSAEAFGSKRFILVLRDPIARHYSEYQMRLRVCVSECTEGKKKNPKRTDDDAYRKERFARNCKQVTYNFYPGATQKTLKWMTFFQYIHSPWGKKEISRGHFKQHISNWLKTVRRDQLFIVNFASLVKNTTVVYNAMMRFIGLKDHEDKISLSEPSYKGRNHSYDSFSYLDCASYARLAGYYAKVNKGLVEFINNGSGPRNPFEPAFVGFDETKCRSKGGDNADDFITDDEKSDDKGHVRGLV